MNDLLPDPMKTILVAALAASYLWIASTAPSAAQTPEEIQLAAQMIGWLAIPKTPVPPDTVVLDQNAIEERTRCAVRKLTGLGLSAFPELIARLNDPRPALPFRNVLPGTVGDACYCILSGQLYALPRDYPASLFRRGKNGELQARPTTERHLFTAESLPTWLASRKDKTMAELQLETFTWVYNVEWSIGTSSKDEFNKYITPLENALFMLHGVVEAEAEAKRK